MWLLEAPVRKIILQMHTAARTSQCWSRQTQWMTPPHGVHHALPMGRHPLVPGQGWRNPGSADTHLAASRAMVVLNSEARVAFLQPGTSARTAGCCFFFIDEIFFVHKTPSNRQPPTAVGYAQSLSVPPQPQSVTPNRHWPLSYCYQLPCSRKKKPYRTAVTAMHVVCILASRTAHQRP